ncbi:MAG: hypothetical protein DMF63_01745 [Acidobacteria bacterium]|nr:MAG: hypothetical protein DMF63_01745 [Acidobacteriota bacterium]
MRLNLILTFVIGMAIVSVGCGGATTPTGGSNTNVANAAANGNVNAVPANTELGTTKKPEVQTTNNAPTLGPVINAYYDALRKKDAAAVRKAMSEDFLKSTEADMKAEKKTDIVAFLTEFDKVPDGNMEVRNEQIDGNRGTAIVKGGSYVGDGIVMVFKNEGGSWKVSNEVPK